jgi:hypothetical protein
MAAAASNLKTRPALREVKSLATSGISALEACSQYASLQEGGTCYFAAIVNLLLCTDVFRHYLTRVLNAQRCIKPPGFFDGPYAEDMDFIDMLLHIFYKQTCISFSYSKKRTFSSDIDDRLIGLFFRGAETPDGAVGETVAVELMRLLGITCAIDNGSMPKDEDVRILTRSNGYFREIYQNSTKYTLVGGIGNLNFTRGFGHVVACLLCFGKPYIFDSNNFTLDVDWTAPAAELSSTVCLMRVLYNYYCTGTAQVISWFFVRGVYVSERFLEANARAVSCRPDLTCKTVLKQPSVTAQDIQSSIIFKSSVHPVIRHELNKLQAAYPYINVRRSRVFGLVFTTPAQDYAVHYLPSKNLFTTSVCNACFPKSEDSLVSTAIGFLLLRMTGVLSKSDRSILRYILIDVKNEIDKGLCFYYKKNATDMKACGVPFIDVTYKGVAFYVENQKQLEVELVTDASGTRVYKSLDGVGTYATLEDAIRENFISPKPLARTGSDAFDESTDDESTAKKQKT